MPEPDLSARARQPRIQHEPQMTEAFWRSLKRGSLLREYPVVVGEQGSRRRAIDALIVVQGEFREYHWSGAPELTGEPVMVVQTKAYRTDAALVGQALLSPILLRRRQPEVGSVESVLISPSPEPFLTALLRRHSVREVALPGPLANVSHIKLRRGPESDLDFLHGRLGGEMLLNVPMAAADGTDPILTANAVVLIDRPWKRTLVANRNSATELIRGSRAVAIVSSTASLGMYVAGFAMVARELLLAAGASDASAVALVGTRDRAVEEALAHFPT
jgi:hypothetical protein